MLFIRQMNMLETNVLSDIRSLSSSLFLSFLFHPSVSLHLSCCGFAEMHGLSCVKKVSAATDQNDLVIDTSSV